MAPKAPKPAKNVGAMGGFATGDPLTMLVGGLLGRRNKTPDPSYEGQIDVGGPFQPTQYTGPSLDAYTAGPTGGMDVTSAGPAEAFFANTGASMMGPTLSEAYALDAESKLSGPGQAQTTFGQQQGRLAGPTASQGALQGAQASFSGPSETANFRQATAGQFAGAGSGEQFWNQMQGRMQNPTFSEQAFQGLQDAPGFDAFYDRARERQAGGINDQLAARGQYGSSAGLDQISQGMSDLNAQQANREADFMLQQQQQTLGAAGQADTASQGLMGLGVQGSTAAQQQQLARLGLGGQLAGQAFGERLGAQSLLGQLAGQTDQAHVGAFNALMGGAGAADQSELARVMGLGNLVSGADAARTGQFGAAAGAAQGAGSERLGRIGTGLGAQQAATSQFLNVLGSSLMSMIGADEALFNNAVAGEVGTLGTSTEFKRQDYLDTVADQQFIADQVQQGVQTGASMVPMGF